MLALWSERIKAQKWTKVISEVISPIFLCVIQIVLQQISINLPGSCPPQIVEIAGLKIALGALVFINSATNRLQLKISGCHQSESVFYQALLQQHWQQQLHFLAISNTDSF